MHRGLKTTNVCFSKLSLNIIVNFMEWNFTHSGEILETLIVAHFLNLVRISWWLASLLQNHSQRSVGHCVRLSASLCKRKWCTHLICIYVCGCIRYMQLANSCKLYWSQADGFHARSAWTEISEKLKIKFTLTWCWCINSLYNVFPG